MVMGKAAQDLGSALKEEQEILMALADMVIEAYVAESALLRTQKLISVHGQEAVSRQIAMTQVYVYEAADMIWSRGKEAIASFAKTQEQGMLLKGLKILTRSPLVNTRSLRREVAKGMIEKGAYAY